MNKDTLLNTHILEGMAKDIFDKDKFTLHCSKHNYVYSKTVKPRFDCKECMMVQFTGLMCNTPPEKMLETMEMLEYTVRKLIEADNNGTLDRKTLFAHPKITIEQEDGTIKTYDANLTRN